MPAVPARLRLVFMGAPAFAVPSLRALHEAGHEIAAVYTQPPRPAGRGLKDTLTPVHAYALANGLPVCIPATLKTAQAQEEFATHRAQAAVVAAYGLLLPPAILNAYPLGCINVHPSLLPRWRGAAPIQRTLMAGDKETGVCIMQMDEGLDTGPVLMRESFSIPDDLNAGMLHDALAEKGANLLLKSLDALARSDIAPMPQSSEGATYARKITREECRIDWRRTAQEVWWQVRGLSPAPGAYFMHQGEPVKILAARWHAYDSGNAPGTVMDEAFAVACGSGILQPLEMQRAGRKPMRTEEVLRGWAVPAGTRLE